MASRNQNKRPRSPSNKKGAAEEVPLDKRKRIGAERMELQGTEGRGRLPLAPMNKGPDAGAANDVGSAEGTECSTVEFTKEDVEALLNKKMKKRKMEQMTERLELCEKWFKNVEEGYIKEKEKHQSALEAAEKKFTDTGRK